MHVQTLSLALALAMSDTSIAGTASKHARLSNHIITGWPRLTSGSGTSACKGIFKIARTAFNSNEPSFDWPVPSTKGSGYTTVAARDEEDVSGGRGLFAQKRTFKELIQENSSHQTFQVFWGRSLAGGKRLVLAEAPFNWRGSFYYVYVLDQKVTAEKVFHAVAVENDKPDSIRPFSSELGQPPWVLKRDGDKSLWVVQDPSLWSPRWTAKKLEVQGLASRCIVSFGPQTKSSVSLLPSEVSRFAALLDEALGPGADEGTLQETAATRQAVWQDWEIAAIRPWASAAVGYNTHKEVSEGLQAWALRNAKRTKVLNSIDRQYPKAETALSVFYTQYFHLGKEPSKQAAHYVIDSMYRAYFTFHRDNGEITAKSAKNPWPEGTR